MKNMICTFFALTFLSLSVTAEDNKKPQEFWNKDGWSKIFYCRSYHYDFNEGVHNAQGYNEAHHNCFGAQKGGYFVMTLTNSIRNRSFVAGKSFLNNATENLRYGYSLALASGYGARGVGMILPMASLSYELRGVHDMLNNFAVDFHTVGEISELQFRYKFDADDPEYQPQPAESDWVVEYSLGTLTNRYGISYKFKEYDDWRGSFVVTGKLWEGEYDFDDQWYEHGTALVQREVMDTKGVGGKVTWYPWNNAWVGVYAGVAYHDFSYSTEYQFHDWIRDPELNPNHPETSVQLSNGDTHSLDVNSRVWGKVNWTDKLTPTFGIRFGNPYESDKHVNLFAEFGVMSVGGIEGEADYNIPGLTEQEQAKVRQELDKWVERETDKYSKYKMIPVFNLGLSWRF